MRWSCSDSKTVSVECDCMYADWWVLNSPFLERCSVSWIFTRRSASLDRKESLKLDGNLKVTLCRGLAF